MASGDPGHDFEPADAEGEPAPPAVCPRCWLALPVSGVCGSCE